MEIEATNTNTLTGNSNVQTSVTGSANIDDAIKQKLRSQDELAKKFWDVMKVLISKYVENNVEAPNSIKIFCKIIKGIQLVNRHFCIKHVGAFFFKFRDHIDNNDCKFIYTFDFKSQQEDWRDYIVQFNKSLASKVHTMAVEIRYFFNITTRIMDEQKSIKMCKTFLRWYCEYAMIEKDLEKLK